jgi:hypothetical protein
MQVDQKHAAGKECANVDKQRRRRASGGNHSAAEDRAQYERSGESDVEGGVCLALCLVRFILKALGRCLGCRLYWQLIASGPRHLCA